MPLKNSLGVERRVDLASLFCMIGRHGPAVALAIIAMVSVLAGFVIYRNVRGKRRKAEVDASEGRSRGEPGDESVRSPERERRSAPLTDESDEDPSDVPRKAHLIRSDFTARKRHVEKTQPSYSPPGNDVVKQAAKEVQTRDSSECVRSFIREGDRQAESVQHENYKVPEGEMEEVAGGWTAWWTSGSQAYECGVKEMQLFVDERGSEKQIQTEEDATQGPDISDDKVDLQEENEFKLVCDKPTCTDQSREDVDHTVRSELLREELVVSCKVDCDEDSKEASNSQKSVCYDQYNGCTHIEEERSNPVNAEEKSTSGSQVNAVELQSRSVERDESESLLPQDQCIQEASLEGGDWRGRAETRNVYSDKQDDCRNGEHVGSFVQDQPCIALDQTSSGACISDVHPGRGQLVEDNENADLQRASDGTEDEPVNGLTMSDEEHDAHVTVPSCDLNPEPAEEMLNCEAVVPLGSIAYATVSKVEEETIAHHSLAANGQIPTIVLHEVGEDSPKTHFVGHSPETANIPLEKADCENSSPQSSSDSKVNEPKSTDDSTAVLEPDLDLKSEPSVGAFEQPLPTAIFPDQPNTDLKRESNADEVAGGDRCVTTSDIEDNGASVLDGNDCDAHCTAVEEASGSLQCECQDQQDDDMDCKTSDETCANSAPSQTPEERSSAVFTSYSLTSHTEFSEEFATVVTAEFSAMTVNVALPSITPCDTFSNDEGLDPTVSVISETQVTEIGCTELQVMDCEPQTQTTLYADDVAVYVAKVEAKLESYAVNEDSFGHEIEDSYHELVEKLMEHITSTVATLTDELADTSAVVDLDEKKEGGSSEKKDTSKEKNEEEVREKTEISIMEATMDHNEWITDGSYQTLPWMNLPFQTKTDQRPTVEHPPHSLTDSKSMDIDMMLPSDAKQTSSPGLVDENADNGKKIVAVQPMPQNVNITFRVHYVTHSPHHTVAITGNQQELGNWEGFIPLEKAKDGHWMIVLSLPAESLVEWKFVVVEEGAVRRWEECGNRLLDTGCGDDILVHKCWGFL
ncbi:uncharacterized protein stbd1 [Synchiropus splendidus]|uniref:uncharacterized protein stbd1 n=1 Tax=Synchiropus splendidus TaxID=270530 RepID=UPI00237E95D2|nr:uncharacterized protein stbd1 [Synchiropus splendidus]